MLAAAGAARAIPSAPDPRHDAKATPWANVLINVLVPAADQHQHRDGRSLFNVNNLYKTFAVWDDGKYRYNTVADRSLSRGLDNRDFGHGFMRRPATFEFVLSVFPNPNPPPATIVLPFPAWAKTILLGPVRTVWELMVNGVGVNVNNVLIWTQMQFVETAVAGVSDFKIKFDIVYPIDAAGNTMPFPDESDFDSDGNYIPSPPAPLAGGAPQGGIERLLAFWTPSRKQLTFNSKINWYQTAGDANVLNGGALFDFHTVALPEWGHVLGLDHPVGVVAPANIMTGAPKLRRNAGNPQGFNFTIDVDSIAGAKNLYSIVRGGHRRHRR
jgi:hypothetical protein